MTLQRLLHEGQRCVLVPRPGDVALEDFAIVIDRAPEVDHLAIELHVHFIKMPSPLSNIPHPVHAPATDLTGKERAEPVPPQAHCLMAKVVAALEQQVFHIPQRQRKPHIQHHDLADQLG